MSSSIGRIWPYTLVLLACLSAATNAAAKQLYGRAGCGLGSLIIPPGGPQTSVTTSNLSGYMQTLGISSGTSNCKPTYRSIHVAAQEEFIKTNLWTLSREMVRGEGETLRAYTSVLGCADDQFPLVAGRLRESFAEIFSVPGALAVLDATKDSLREQPAVAAVCDQLI